MRAGPKVQSIMQTIGKKVFDDLYIHISEIRSVQDDVHVKLINNALKTIESEQSGVNVVKLNIRSCKVINFQPTSTQLLTSMQSGYGIFGGAVKGWAKLKFTPERVRWVKREEWHPDQKGRDEADGSYVLEIPFSDERELVGDILRFGSDVQVIRPSNLVSEIKKYESGPRKLQLDTTLAT
jgi:hypothetical protein